ncbi:MAG: hypothetical protein AAFQ99_10905 [Pseudomonadota bacterium]
MDEWLSYSLADFLLFSPEAYWRLFELMNNALWPLPVLLPAILLVAAIITVKAWKYAGWAVGFIVAICWAVVANVFFTSHYAAINWSVPWITPLVWLQACLVLVLFPGLRFTTGARYWWLACGIVALSLAYPIVGLAAGRPLAQSEVAGLAPDPTALMTLGLLALSSLTWRVFLLSILPVCWLLFSAATLVAMAEPIVWVLVVCIVMFVLLLLGECLSTLRQR